MIGHETSRELAAISLDFDLSPEELAELDGHLAACEACRAYAAALANDVVGLAALPLVDAPERVRRAVLAGGRRRRLSATSWAAMAAVIALTILPLATAVVFLRDIGGGSIGAAPGVAETTEPGPAASGAPPASQEPGASGAPEAPLDPAQLAWQPVKLPPAGDLPPVSALNAVAYVPGLSWYAVGGACSRRGGPEETGPPPSICAPAVLRSDDGVTWARVADVGDLSETEGRPGPAAGMYDVVAGGPGLVAVGVSNVRDLDDPRVDIAEPAVWVSTDGQAWERVRDDDLDDGYMTAVTVLPDGSLVAVGAAPGVGPQPAAWRSGPDGRSWERIPDAFDSPGQVIDGFVIDVATVGDAPIGIGFQGRRNASTFSIGRDGRWVPTSAADAFDEEAWYPQSISVSDGGTLVAVGSRLPHPEPHEPDIAWRSSDGVSWELGRFEPTIVDSGQPSGQGLSVVTSVGDAFVAGGSQPEGPPGLWLSHDGLEWAILPGSEPIETGDVLGLAAGADRMVAVGESQTVGGAPAIWVGLPEGGAP